MNTKGRASLPRCEEVRRRRLRLISQGKRFIDVSAKQENCTVDKELLAGTSGTACVSEQCVHAAAQLCPLWPVAQGK